MLRLGEGLCDYRVTRECIRQSTILRTFSALLHFRRDQRQRARQGWVDQAQQALVTWPHSARFWRLCCLLLLAPVFGGRVLRKALLYRRLVHAAWIAPPCWKPHAMKPMRRRRF